MHRDNFFGSGGRAFGRTSGRRACRRRRKKNAGVRGAAAPRPISVKGGVWGGEAPPAKIRGVWGAAPPSQNGKFFEKFFEFFFEKFWKLSPPSSIYLINFSQPVRAWLLVHAHHNEFHCVPTQVSGIQKWSLCSTGPRKSKTIYSNPGLVGIRRSRRNDRKKFEKFLYNSFVCSFARSKIFQILIRADTIELVQKLSNFESSSRFFGRLKIFDFRDAHYLLHALTVENCHY